MMMKSAITDLGKFATEEQRRFESITLPQERKEKGHYGTPWSLAEFMAGMFSRIPDGLVRILDPGAGVGTLSAALCARILGLKSPRQLEIDLWEPDSKLVPYLRRTMEHCRLSLKKLGHRLNFTICVDDFVLANTQRTLFENDQAPSYHLTILNPPYYKLRKDSPHARSMEHIVHGQPNIYSFFMAKTAEFLYTGGEMVAITPRSYFNGPYFKKFRRWFFDRMSPRQIHVFESRNDAFHENDVLQENVILFVEKGGSPQEIVLSNSFGRDVTSVKKCFANDMVILDKSNNDLIIRVAKCPVENEILRTLDALPNRLNSLGFEVSTGPVVAFRSTQFLRTDKLANTAPLLWLHNIRPFAIRFPAKSAKPGHIEVNEKSLRLLVPANRCVLLKRFSSKEEKRRLVAAVLEPSDSYAEWVGLENHLNYVHKKGKQLTRGEATGLAAFFNSALVDRYFRAISGNTQVNAAEIRAMPLPDADTLLQNRGRNRAIGRPRFSIR